MSRLNPLHSWRFSSSGMWSSVVGRAVPKLSTDRSAHSKRLELLAH